MLPTGKDGGLGWTEKGTLTDWIRSGVRAPFEHVAIEVSKLSFWSRKDTRVAVNGIATIPLLDFR